MFHRVRRKMHWHYTLIAILIIDNINTVYPKSIDSTEKNFPNDHDYSFDNNIIDFDSAYADKLSREQGTTAWNSGKNFNKESHRYIVVPEDTKKNKTEIGSIDNKAEVTTTETSEIPKELIVTTEDELIALIESTAEPDLTVIPLSTTVKTTTIGITEVFTATQPTTTQNNDTSTSSYVYIDTTEYIPTANTESNKTEFINTTKREVQNYTTTTFKSSLSKTEITPTKDTNIPEVTTPDFELIYNSTDNPDIKTETVSTTPENKNTSLKDDLNAKTTNKTGTISRNDGDSSEETDVPIFTELDTENVEEVPEDYYDVKDVMPTKPPNNDALSLIFGLAGSVVESMAEKVVPKGIFDLFKRMQKQNEALEAERLRSREENGGLGQFGRGILKSISTGLSKPFTQLMQSTRDKGSLDSDHGFVASLASGVTSVASAATSAATSLVDQFKTRVQAIYPGTIWCGDGHSVQARSSDLGLFFFTDTCCRQHDACKLYIKSGETKFGLTNTGLFTRSHCSCDTKFRECLQNTNSLVSGQVGLTYFNVLGPQCFRKAHPIIRCVRRTSVHVDLCATPRIRHWPTWSCCDGDMKPYFSPHIDCTGFPAEGLIKFGIVSIQDNHNRITGQRCEEYELDYTQPKMWQWFDNETY